MTILNLTHKIYFPLKHKKGYFYSLCRYKYVTKGGIDVEKTDFPIMLTVNEVSQILGTSKRLAYEIMGKKDFPLIKIGRHKKVYRDSFFKWMEQAN